MTYGASQGEGARKRGDPALDAGRQLATHGREVACFSRSACSMTTAMNTSREATSAPSNTPSSSPRTNTANVSSSCC